MTSRKFEFDSKGVEDMGEKIPAAVEGNRKQSYCQHSICRRHRAVRSMTVNNKHSVGSNSSVLCMSIKMLQPVTRRLEPSSHRSTAGLCLALGVSEQHISSSACI